MSIKSSILQTLLCLTMLILMLTYSASALQKEKETFEYLLNHGAELYKDKNYDDAIRELKKARMLNADSAEVKFLLSLAYRGKHQRNEAIHFAEEAIKHQLVFPDAHYVLAVLLYERYKSEYTSDRTTSQYSFKQAKEKLLMAINQGAKSANVFELKGKMEFDELHFAVALESYKEALYLAPPQFPELEKLNEKIEQLTKILEFKKQHESEVDLKPKPLNRPMPNYTDQARRDKIQGMVAVFVRIDEQGGIAECVPFLPLGVGLDEEAVRAVKKMKFNPAIKNNQAVAYWVMVTVEFNLRL